MHSSGINGEGELRGHTANPDSPGKTAVKTECVYSKDVHIHHEKQYLLVNNIWRCVSTAQFRGEWCW